MLLIGNTGYHFKSSPGNCQLKSHTAEREERKMDYFIYNQLAQPPTNSRVGLMIRREGIS